MAEEASHPANLKKQPSKFGKFMTGLGKATKKSMNKASKQMAKGVVKTRQMAIEKIAKAPTSAEDPEIVSALERLKTTKNEINTISEIVRNLYDARLSEATYLIQLAEKLQSVQISQNDAFGTYVQCMGRGLSELESVESSHLTKMEDEFVKPLEKFRDFDIEEVQKLKLKYKRAKADYDLALHRLTKAKESSDQNKISQATQKRDATYTELQALRNQIKFQVNNLEQKKQINLLGCLEQYWESYSAYAKAQSNVLTKNTISKESYMNQAQVFNNDINNNFNDEKVADIGANNQTPNNPNVIQNEIEYQEEQETANFMDDDLNNNNNHNNVENDLGLPAPPPAFNEPHQQNAEYNPFGNDDDDEI